jgi:hypothetical protein
MSPKRNRRTNNNGGRPVRPRLETVRQDEAPALRPVDDLVPDEGGTVARSRVSNAAGLCSRDLVDGWVAQYEEPHSIVSAWELLGAIARNFTLFSELLFFCMNGMLRLPTSVRPLIRYSAVPRGSISNNVMNDFLGDPFGRYDLLPDSTSIIIAIKVDSRFIDWIKVTKVDQCFRAYACQNIMDAEIVSVFGGRIIWTGDLPHVDCMYSSTLYSGATSDCPTANLRGRDCNLHILDSEHCHLLLAASCFRTLPGDEANLSMDDAGAIWALRDIEADSELVLQGS